MALANKEKSLEAALKIANKVRVAIGYPPVDRLYPGVPRNGATCAISETVYDDDVDREKWAVLTAGGRVTVWEKSAVQDFPLQRFTITPKVEERWKKTPGAASFIHYFDAGKFPDLIKK